MHFFDVDYSFIQQMLDYVSQLFVTEDKKTKVKFYFNNVKFKSIRIVANRDSLLRRIFHWIKQFKDLSFKVSVKLKLKKNIMNLHNEFEN